MTNLLEQAINCDDPGPHCRDHSRHARHRVRRCGELLPSRRIGPATASGVAARSPRSWAMGYFARRIDHHRSRLVRRCFF